MCDCGNLLGLQVVSGAEREIMDKTRAVEELSELLFA